PPRQPSSGGPAAPPVGGISTFLVSIGLTAPDEAGISSAQKDALKGDRRHAAILAPASRSRGPLRDQCRRREPRAELLWQGLRLALRGLGAAGGLPDPGRRRRSARPLGCSPEAPRAGTGPAHGRLRAHR